MHPLSKTVTAAPVFRPVAGPSLVRNNGTAMTNGGFEDVQEPGQEERYERTKEAKICKVCYRKGVTRPVSHASSREQQTKP